MSPVGAFDAKTHLAELLDRVSRGETITITRHGVPAALLVPVQPAGPSLTHAEIVQAMRTLRKRILARSRGKKLDVRTLVREGRRH